MAIKVGQAFERTSANPIDTSLALTRADMLTVNDNLMPAYYFTICQDDGKIYLYDKTATASATTGKFKEFSGGSGGSEVFSTTETLSDEINDTTTVLAADLPGVSFSDITVGITLIRDDKGTVGLVTAKNGTTDVTVTTATTSTPTKELTQAEYDALTEAEKNNGTIYFITDNYVGSTYVGAYDTIYSTTERVVGSYMGKPLYQKTFVKENVVLSGNGTTFINMGAGAENCKLVNSFGSRDELETIPYAWTSLDMIGFINETDNYFGIEAYRTGSGFTIPKIVMTYQYTKTTDTTSPVEYASPNDYSTSEKIVGTWIDGKPPYQKTYEYTVLSVDGSGIILDSSLKAPNAKLVSADVVKWPGTSGDTWYQAITSESNSRWIEVGITPNGVSTNYHGRSVNNILYITIKYIKEN